MLRRVSVVATSVREISSTLSIWFSAALDAAYAANLNKGSQRQALSYLELEEVPIFHFSKVLRRARIAGHEDNSPDWNRSLQKLLCCNDGTNGIGMKMESEFIKRAKKKLMIRKRRQVAVQPISAGFGQRPTVVSSIKCINESNA